MATPHLAGSAAVVRGQQPTWSAAEVRSAIVNTAEQGVLKQATSTNLETNVNKIGSGLDNLFSAVTATVALDPVSVSFGAVPSGSGQTKTFDVALTNLGTSQATFTLSVGSSTGTGVSYSVSPASIQLDPGASGNATVTMEATEGASAGGHQGEARSRQWWRSCACGSIYLGQVIRKIARRAGTRSNTASLFFRSRANKIDNSEAFDVKVVACQPHPRSSAICLLQVLISAFLAILFLQSGIDKVVDRRGNLEWLKGHFAKSPLAGIVPAMVTAITILEIAAGALSAIGCVVIIFSRSSTVAFYGAVISAIAILALFFGQRMAKDYAGAAVLVPYFLLALAAIYLLAPR